MAQWRGWRKALTVLAFIGPTLIGILIFNIYPILFNTYISLTNRNRYHPNPDCSVELTGILEPTCWPVFQKHAPKGLGEPFRLQDPVYGNYSDLIGQFFTTPVLIAIGKLAACFVPLIVARQINKAWKRQRERPAPRAVILWPTSILGFPILLSFALGHQFGWADITFPPWLGILTIGILLFLALNYKKWSDHEFLAQANTLAAITSGILLVFFLNVREAFAVLSGSGDFLVVNFNTILYVAACIPLFFLVGLSLALLLNVPDLPGRTFFRVVLIVPWAASTVAVMMSLVWKFFFQEQGTINQLVALLGLEGKAWLQDPTTAFIVIIVANVWYSYPFFMVTTLGALQSIPVELYEAAEVDGASWWQRLRNITLPLIRPAIIPAIVLSSITTFQMFGTVWAITGGGPSRGAGAPGATDLVMTYAYKQVFQTAAYGRMGAFAVIMFILLFAATLYSLRISRITKGAYE